VTSSSPRPVCSGVIPFPAHLPGPAVTHRSATPLCPASSTLISDAMLGRSPALPKQSDQTLCQGEHLLCGPATRSLPASQQVPSLSTPRVRDGGLFSLHPYIHLRGYLIFNRQCFLPFLIMAITQTLKPSCNLWCSMLAVNVFPWLH
jgi:hypothetical protein